MLRNTEYVCVNRTYRKPEPKHRKKTFIKMKRGGKEPNTYTVSMQYATEYVYAASMYLHENRVRRKKHNLKLYPI